MKYVVQCGRKENEYVKRMYSEIPELEEMHDSLSTEKYAKKMDCHIAMSGFMDCMKIKQSHVHLEDDVILCRGFKEKAEHIIKQCPNDMIRFFSRPTDKFGGWSHYGLWNQCVYFPAWFKSGVVNYFENVWWQNPYNRENGWNWFDCVTNDYLRHIKKKCFVVVPSLVEHVTGPSTFGGRPHQRKAGIYIDDLFYPDLVQYIVFKEDI